MKTIHIEGYGKDIDIAANLSDSSLSPDFAFGEESADTISDIFLRFYESDKKCTLEEAMKGHLKKMFGAMEVVGQDYGYSEYTIEGFDVSSARLGGHDLAKIIKDHGDKYLHILIDQVK